MLSKTAYWGELALQRVGGMPRGSGRLHALRGQRLYTPLVLVNGFYLLNRNHIVHLAAFTNRR